MLEMNLLPWREYQRLYWRRVRLALALAGVVVLVITFSVWLFKHDSAATPTLLTQASEPEVPAIKFIGLLQQNARVWGIILLPNGSTQEVHTGSKIPQTNVRVVKISAAGLVLSVNHHEYVVKMAGTL